MEPISFKDKLLNKEIDFITDPTLDHQTQMECHYESKIPLELQTPPQEHNISVPITNEDKQRIYYPRRFFSYY